VRLLPVRVVWLALPLGAGAAASGALDGWDDAPRIVAYVLLWLAWGVGLVALLAPRPIGLTAVRTVAPALLVLAVVELGWGDASTQAGVVAVAITLAAAVLVADPAVAIASANGIAYGDERRFPLRTPPALYLAPVPLARALAVAGLASAPLLFAAGEVWWGLLALVGIPIAVWSLRALHTLAQRWFVRVPAGFVLVDPLTLADPVLLVRRTLRSMTSVRGTAPPAAGTVDLRLGATGGSVALAIDGSIEVVRGSGRRGRAETLHPDGLLVALAGRRELLAPGDRDRRGAQAAMPPPSSSAPPSARS
jgi:hypothetical protein